MNQTSIFDMLYPKYKITKPIRLIEFFSGYGSQALALKYSSIHFEHWKTCEWAVKSIQAYKDIHYWNDNEDYSKNMSVEQIKEYLFNKGISSNYNEPMSKEQINRLNEKQVRTIYNNIIATHNLVNIQQVKGEDLEMVDTDKYDYIWTYSFPCQDLSNAGLKKGFNDTSTRSGMLWEVERILEECDKIGQKPRILLMENVIQVHSPGENLENFHKWQLKLESLGYKNYMQDLIATDYGIPQTRNRCFMVSILGDYSYTFPQPIPLKLKLKDLLEQNVDEKYYLSDKMLDYIISKDDKYQVNENKLVINRDIACSKTTREGWTRADTSDYVCDDLEDNCNIKNGCKQVFDLNYYNHEQSNRVYDPDYSSPTLRTKSDEAGAIKIDETKRISGIYDKEGIEHQAGSIYDINYSAPTLTTMTGGNRQPFIQIKNATKQGYLEAIEGDGIDLAQPNSETRRGRVQKEAIQTLTTQNNLGVCVGTYQYSKSDNFMKGKDRLQLGKEVSDTLQTTQKEGVVYNDLRIRKLTPKECFRLMGVRDEDFEKCAKNQSNASLYHLAGDSIVVDVLCHIFSQFFKDS